MRIKLSHRLKIFPEYIRNWYASGDGTWVAKDQKWERDSPFTIYPFELFECSPCVYFIFPKLIRIVQLYQRKKGKKVNEFSLTHSFPLELFTSWPCLVASTATYVLMNRNLNIQSWAPLWVPLFSIWPPIPWAPKFSVSNTAILLLHLCSHKGWWAVGGPAICERSNPPSPAFHPLSQETLPKAKPEAQIPTRAPLPAPLRMHHSHHFDSSPLS